MSIPEIFAREGEAGFRARETEVLARLGKGSGAIIATGGGCVTRQENRDLLRQNGAVVWIKRALDVLPTDGRPLSQANSAATLYEQRREKYASFSDIVIENDGTIEEAVRKIKEALK
jgi:shikimate dehydrogenase